MKVSFIETEIPNYRALEDALLNRNREEIKNEFDKLYSNENERTEKLSSFYDGLTQTIVENKNVPIHLQNIIESTLYISEEFDLTYPVSVMNTVCNELISLDNRYFCATPLDKIFQQLVPFVSTSVLDVLISKFFVRIKQITNSEGDDYLSYEIYEQELVKNLISYFDSRNEINEESINLINSLFSLLLEEDYNIISILNNRPYMCSKIIGDEIIDTLLNRLNYADGSFSMNFDDEPFNFQEFLFILKESRGVIILLFVKLVEIFISYLQLEAPQNHRESKMVLFRSIEIFYESFYDAFNKLDEDVITKIITHIIGNINSPGTDWDNRYIYFPLLTKFGAYANDPAKDLVYNNLNAFLKNSIIGSFESFWKLINKRDQRMILSHSGFVQTLQSAVETDFEYYKIVWCLDNDDLLIGIFREIEDAENDMIKWLTDNISLLEFPKNSYIEIIIEIVNSTGDPEIFKLYTNLINSNLLKFEDRLKTKYVNVLYDSLLNFNSREIQENAQNILTEAKFDIFSLTQPTSRFVNGLVRLFGKLDDLITDRSQYEIPLDYIVEYQNLIDKDLSKRDLKESLFSDFLHISEITPEIFGWIAQLLIKLDALFVDDPSKFEGVKTAVSRSDVSEIKLKTEFFLQLKPKNKLNPEELIFWNEMESMLKQEVNEIDLEVPLDEKGLDE